MTRSPKHPTSAPRRRSRMAGAFAGVAVLLLLGLAVMGPQASASGPGPVWQNWWNGVDGAPGGIHAPVSWVGTPAHVDFPGGEDGDDQGFSFDGSNHVAGPHALGNFGSDDFRVNLRFQTTQADAFQHDLVSARASCASSPFWQVFVSGTGRVSFQFYGTDGVVTTLSHPNPVNDGAPQWLNITRTGATLNLSLNGVTESVTINGTGDYTLIDQHLRLGGGNPCVNVGALRPFVGAVDHLYIDQGNDPAGQDLSLVQQTTPVVPAGGSGSLAVNRLNGSESSVDLAEVTFRAPAGMTFTGVSDANSTCSLVDPARITCPATDYGPEGTNAVTIAFDVAPSATPDSTLNVMGTFTNLTNTDPDHTNDRGVPLAVTVSPEVGIALADPMVAGGAVGLAALAIAVGAVIRRRSQA